MRNRALPDLRLGFSFPAGKSVFLDKMQLARDNETVRLLPEIKFSQLASSACLYHETVTANPRASHAKSFRRESLLLLYRLDFKQNTYGFCNRHEFPKVGPYVEQKQRVKPEQPVLVDYLIRGLGPEVLVRIRDRGRLAKLVNLQSGYANSSDY